MAKFFHLLLMVSIGVTLFAPSLQTPFYYDDYYHFVENQRLLEAKTAGDIFKNGRQETRPIYNLSLYLQNKLFSTDRVKAHAINLALHLAVTVLLYFFLLSLSLSSTVALMTSLLFLIHPIGVETVVYFNSRSGLLALLFVLLGLQFKKGAPLFFILGMGSKEDAIVGVPIYLLFDYVQNRFFRWKENLPVIATLLTLPILYLFFKSPHTDTVGTHVLSPWVYFWHQGSLIPLHLSLFFFPWPLTLDRDLPSILFNPGVILLGWILLIWISRLAWQFRTSPFAWGWFWILLALLPTHSFIPLLDEEATRILYPALPGMSLCVVSLLPFLSVKEPIQKMAVGFLACYLTLFTSFQIRIWLDPIRLWTRVTEAAPSRWRPWTNLAIEHAEKENWEEAEKAMSKAQEIEPHHPWVLYNSAALWATRTDGQQNVEVAKKELHEVLEQWPHHLRANELLEKLEKEFPTVKLKKR